MRQTRHSNLDQLKVQSSSEGFYIRQAFDMQTKSDTMARIADIKLEPDIKGALAGIPVELAKYSPKGTKGKMQPTTAQKKRRKHYKQLAKIS